MGLLGSCGACWHVKNDTTEHIGHSRYILTLNTYLSSKALWYANSEKVNALDFLVQVVRGFRQMKYLARLNNIFHCSRLKKKKKDQESIRYIIAESAAQFLLRGVDSFVIHRNTH